MLLFVPLHLLKLDTDATPCSLSIVLIVAPWVNLRWESKVYILELKDFQWLIERRMRLRTQSISQPGFDLFILSWCKLKCFRLYAGSLTNAQAHITKDTHTLISIHTYPHKLKCTCTNMHLCRAATHDAWCQDCLEKCTTAHNKWILLKGLYFTLQWVSCTLIICETLWKIGIRCPLWSTTTTKSDLFQNHVEVKYRFKIITWNNNNNNIY